MLFLISIMHRKSAVCILKTHEQILALTNTHVRYILRLEHDYLKTKIAVFLCLHIESFNC